MKKIVPETTQLTLANGTSAFLRLFSCKKQEKFPSRSIRKSLNINDVINSYTRIQIERQSFIAPPVQPSAASQNMPRQVFSHLILNVAWIGWTIPESGQEERQIDKEGTNSGFDHELTSSDQLDTCLIKNMMN